MSDSSTNSAGDAQQFTRDDVARFLTSAWKFMLAGGIAGGLLVAVYTAFTPQKYGATAVVRMAQIPVLAPTGSYVRENVEAPTFLVEKLKTPSLYTPEVMAACGTQAGRFPGEALVDRLTFTARNSDHVVSVAVRADSADIAKSCATAVVDTIRVLQAAESKLTVDSLHRASKVTQARMADSRASLAALEKGGPQQQIAYLALRDELAYLGKRMDEITTGLELQTEARLAAPIYAPPDAVFPRRPEQLLAIGIIAGMLAGFLLAGLRRRA
jgi:uncharacterized protein involved in exopolysaccharide biosynthesis